MTTKTLWISRDLKDGGAPDNVHFWDVEPTMEGGEYDADNDGSIIGVEFDCTELACILCDMGIRNGVLNHGDLCEVKFDVTIHEHKSNQVAAREFLTRLRSRNDKPTAKEIKDFAERMAR